MQAVSFRESSNFLPSIPSPLGFFCKHLTSKSKQKVVSKINLTKVQFQRQGWQRRDPQAMNRIFCEMTVVVFLSWISGFGCKNHILNAGCCFYSFWIMMRVDICQMEKIQIFNWSKYRFAVFLAYRDDVQLLISCVFFRFVSWISINPLENSSRQWCTWPFDSLIYGDHPWP